MITHGLDDLKGWTESHQSTDLANPPGVSMHTWKEQNIATVVIIAPIQSKKTNWGKRTKGQVGDKYDMWSAESMEGGKTETITKE